MSVLPVLLTIGPVSISSFGFFLSLGFIWATFLVWRLARAWEVSEEKILDLLLLSFFGALIGGRLYFIAFNFQSFDPLKALLLTRYPGLNFWGGLFGGVVAFYFFSRRFRLDFWYIGDFGAVGLLAVIILGDLGCFLGGCGIGIPSNLFFATPVVGVVGNRFPVAALEALILAFLLSKIWKQAIHFHFQGKILSISLIYLGVVKFILEFFRFHQSFALGLVSFFLAFLIVSFGVTIFYRSSKRNPLRDLKSWGKVLVGFFVSSEVRRRGLAGILKSWYNQRIALSWKFKKLKKFLRRARVKPTPENIQ